HMRFSRDWSSDVCSSDLRADLAVPMAVAGAVFMIAFRSSSLLSARQVDLVEGAAIAEMRLLRLFPAPENGIINGDELHLGKLIEIGRAPCRERDESARVP